LAIAYQRNIFANSIVGWPFLVGAVGEPLRKHN